MKNNYFIIHGSYGKPFENWFSWLENELSNKGVDVYVPHFPTPKGQSYNNWEKILKAYLDLGLINENTIFIGHSIAPVFIIKFLLTNKVKIAGLISVSGFNCLIEIEAFDKVNKTFFVDNQVLENVNNYAKFVKCIYSNNDPYIPFKELDNFATFTKADKTVIDNGGHLNAEAGYSTFDKLLGIIK